MSEKHELRAVRATSEDPEEKRTIAQVEHCVDTLERSVLTLRAVLGPENLQPVWIALCRLSGHYTGAISAHPRVDPKQIEETALLNFRNAKDSALDATRKLVAEHELAKRGGKTDG